MPRVKFNTHRLVRVQLVQMGKLSLSLLTADGYIFISMVRVVIALTSSWTTSTYVCKLTDVKYLHMQVLKVLLNGSTTLALVSFDIEICVILYCSISL